MEIGSKIKVLMSLVVFAVMLDVSHWGVVFFCKSSSVNINDLGEDEGHGGREEGLCTTSAVKTPTNWIPCHARNLQ